MIQETDRERYPKVPDADRPCPMRGRERAPYTRRTSALLDIVVLLGAVVADLKKAAEGVAL
jgi:hypothetical protein